MSVVLPGYRVAGTLGRGAQSVIYHVVETKTGQNYALKRVLRRTAEDDRFIEQVETEYRVTSKLSHPYLRRSFALHRRKEWMQLKEVLLLAEFVEGLTLEEHRPPRLDVFLGIFRRVAAGLEAMHAAGFVHADIKPRNILWAPRGIVKIIDFGQSCPIGHRKERIQGTPDYIAPEQIRRAILDARTDVFNVGASMYQVLTGAFYPTGLAPEAIGGGLAVTDAAPPLTPREINPKIPPALSHLVMECCRPNPVDRLADMKQVQKRLAAVQTRWRKARQAAKAQRSTTHEQGKH